MTDITSPLRFLESRTQWWSDGYEKGLPRGSGIGDIDGHLELSGHSLLIEQKPWDGKGAKPPRLTGGQLYALRSLCLRSVDVLLLWQNRGCIVEMQDGHIDIKPGSDPLACQMWQLNHATGQIDTRSYDFRSVESVEVRRLLLRIILHGWADRAESAERSRCHTCGVWSAPNRWPKSVTPTREEMQ